MCRLIRTNISFTLVKLWNCKTLPWPSRNTNGKNAKALNTGQQHKAYGLHFHHKLSSRVINANVLMILPEICYSPHDLKLQSQKTFSTDNKNGHLHKDAACIYIWQTFRE